MGIAIALGGQVHASIYSSDPYGSCTYQTCEPSTRTVLPGSGLEININLQDGQRIPIQGYTVVVTPLNGQNTSFKQIDFYINGVLLQSQPPSPDGTARWFWQPGQHGDTAIKVVVTDQDGQTVTKEFKVIVEQSSGNTTSLNNGSSPSTQPPPPSLLQQIIATPGKLIQKLSPAAKRAIPYILLIIMAANVLVLLLYIRRERREAQQLQNSLAREQQSGQLKRIFTDLISHYLRTPITVIDGALGLLRQTDGLVSSQGLSLQANVEELKSKIDSLVAHINDVDQGTVVQQTFPAFRPKPLWRQPLVFAPIVLIGVIIFSFDYLAQRAGSFNLNYTDLALQLVVFLSLAAGAYFLRSSLKFHQYNTSITKRILQQEVDFNHVRDSLIENASLGLDSSLQTLDADIAKLPPSQAVTLLKKGQQQMHDVVAKFVVAKQLKGATANTQPISTTLNNICMPALQALEAKAQTKGVIVNIVQDLAIQVPSPELLTFVIHTIVDNAIEYSPPQSRVEVSAMQSGHMLTIAVIDHGPGIPAAKHDLLFQAFSKVEGSQVFNHEGMGFSLYLDKLIMDYLLGSITVEGVHPQGTKVTLALSI